MGQQSHMLINAHAIQTILSMLQAKKMLNHGSKEARLAYNEAKKEAKGRVRKVKNEEWIRLGEEMEKDAKGMQKRFWSRVRTKKETATHIRALIKWRTKIWGRGNE